MGVDDRLLGLNDNQASDQDSAGRVGALNEARREEPTTDEPASLREAVQAEKRKQGQKDGSDKEQESDSAVAKMASAPMRKSTSRLLRQAWLHLIDSWGLTLIWINIHVFLGTVLGHNVFCRLGEEWVDNSITASSPEAKEMLGKKGRVPESMGFACCDIGCLLLLLVIISLIAMVAGFLDNPFRALIEMLKGVFSNWSTFDSITSA